MIPTSPISAPTTPRITARRRSSENAEPEGQAEEEPGERDRGEVSAGCGERFAQREVDAPIANVVDRLDERRLKPEERDKRDEATRAVANHFSKTMASRTPMNATAR